MSEPTVTRDDLGRLSMSWGSDRASAEVAREVLEQFVAGHNAHLAEIDRLRAATCTPAERALIDAALAWVAHDNTATANWGAWYDGKNASDDQLRAAADRVLAERTPSDEPDTTNEGDRG